MSVSLETTPFIHLVEYRLYFYQASTSLSSLICSLSPPTSEYEILPGSSWDMLYTRGSTSRGRYLSSVKHEIWISQTWNMNRQVLGSINKWITKNVASVSGSKSIKQVQKIAFLRSVYILKNDLQQNSGNQPFSLYNNDNDNNIIIITITMTMTMIVTVIMTMIMMMMMITSLSFKCQCIYYLGAF